ncbi:hypothetical protein GGR57DRAFT_184694 [Xylariaceae sp. FL1272]|nr:hypothetical protein GGR57DRAFT_184694 [Xylariaceae sp. FL1272]
MGGSINPQVPALVVVSTLLTSISLVIVATRCVVRFGMMFNSGMDDYMIIGGLLFTIGYQAVIYVLQLDGGMGIPFMTLTLEEISTFLKATFAVELLYYGIVFFVKSSIVFMYHRFAIWQSFRRLCYGTNILLAVLFIISVVTTFTQCMPLEKTWDVTRKLPGTCINTTAFFYFTSGFNILLDVWILLLPIPTLRSLQISRHSRYVLYGIFGIGAFATAMSCVRLYSIHIYTEATDPTKDGVLVNLWSMVEVNVAIVCASIPALKPLISPRRLLDERRKRRGYTSQITEPSHSRKPSHVSYLSSNNSQSRIVTTISAGSPVRPALVEESTESSIGLPMHTI